MFKQSTNNTVIIYFNSFTEYEQITANEYEWCMFK